MKADDRLLGALREQVGFLRSSAEAYDRGVEEEARRLATTIRVLVHDTRSSHSVLDQLGVKQRIRFLDTSFQPPRAASVWGAGLAIMEIGPQGGRFIAPLNPAQHRQRDPVDFARWWDRAILTTDPNSMARDSETRREYTRKSIVLTTSNQTGGAHVDSQLDEAYETLVKQLEFSIKAGSGGEDPGPFRNDIALANVRQIAYELHTTLETELPHLVDPGYELSIRKPLPPHLLREAERNDPCPCGSGKKFKRCHGW